MRPIPHRCSAQRIRRYQAGMLSLPIAVLLLLAMTFVSESAYAGKYKPAGAAAREADGEKVEQGGAQSLFNEPGHIVRHNQGSSVLFDLILAPRSRGEYHRHEHAMTLIMLETAGLAHQVKGGSWESAPKREAGSVKVISSYVDEPLEHRGRNTSRSKAARAIAIINLDKKLDLKNIPAANGEEKGAIDNPWFRINRLFVGANVTSQKVQSEFDAYLVQYDDGLRHILEGGQRHSYQSVRGGFSFHPAGSEFQVVNESGKQRQFLLVEVK